MSENLVQHYTDLLDHTISKAVQAEREACADITKGFYSTPERTDTAKAIARAIRERTQPLADEKQKWFESLPRQEKLRHDVVICDCGYKFCEMTSPKTRKQFIDEHYPHRKPPIPQDFTVNRICECGFRESDHSDHALRRLGRCCAQFRPRLESWGANPIEPSENLLHCATCGQKYNAYALCSCFEPKSDEQRRTEGRLSALFIQDRLYGFTRGKALHPEIYPTSEAIDEWFAGLDREVISKDLKFFLCDGCSGRICSSDIQDFDKWARKHFPHQFILDPVNPMDLSFVTENL